MNKKYLFIVTLLAAIVALLVYIGFFKQGATKTVVQQTEVQYQQPPVVWIGPGIYYGIWFGTQSDYDNWCRNNYHNHRNNPHDHDDHHDHDNHHEDRIQERGGGNAGGGRGVGGGGGGRGGGGHGGR